MRGLPGLLRQSVACRACGDRTTALRRIAVPTLVMHGADDAVCNLSGGQAIAAAIHGTELVVLPGMGHSLPRELCPDMAWLMTSEPALTNHGRSDQLLTDVHPSSMVVPSVADCRSEAAACTAARVSGWHVFPSCHAT